MRRQKIDAAALYSDLYVTDTQYTLYDLSRTDDVYHVKMQVRTGGEEAAVTMTEENADGTLTLMVEAVWPKYRDDRAYVHEVTVRPEADGFKYVSNLVIENKLNSKWYVGR